MALHSTPPLPKLVQLCYKERPQASLVLLSSVRKDTSDKVVIVEKKTGTWPPFRIRCNPHLLQQPDLQPCHSLSSSRVKAWQEA